MSDSVAVRWVRHPEDGPGARLVHVNTSANGGGVAELLTNVTEHDAGLRQPGGWAVLSAPGEFFAFTKALHHLFHGRGDPGAVDTGEPLYREVLRAARPLLGAVLRPTDTVVLHDPQTLGLAPWLRTHVHAVYWHCHIGGVHDALGIKPHLWELFDEDLRAVDAVLVTEKEYLAGAPVREVRLVHPAVDPGAPKNVPLTEAQVAAHLRAIGLDADGSTEGPAGRVRQEGALPADAPLVLQVARWDPLKGMEDVLRVAARFGPRVHVVLAGPDPTEVLDDPEGREQLASVEQQYRGLPRAVRARVHLVALSSRDRELNALRVNALQRRADVVLQRSLEEGFGLTVTEAMLKGRAVVATRTGGIPRQIEHGVTGFLVDPGDDDGVVRHVADLVADPGLRDAVGSAASRSVREQYLIDRLAGDYRALVHD